MDFPTYRGVQRLLQVPLHSEWRSSGLVPCSAGPGISDSRYEKRCQQLYQGRALKPQSQLRPRNRPERGLYHTAISFTLRISTVIIDNSTPSSAIRRFTLLVCFIRSIFTTGRTIDVTIRALNMEERGRKGEARVELCRKLLYSFTRPCVYCAGRHQGGCGPGSRHIGYAI